jgi:microcystin-dependent protein
MTNRLLIVILAVLLFVAYLLAQPNVSEHFTATDVPAAVLTSTNFEAIQNVASVFQTGNMVVNNLTATTTFNLLPRGIIVTYYSTTAPSGWQLCDGTNGSPDLRSRFIVGTSYGTTTTQPPISYALKDIGGLDFVTLTTDQLPAHSHGICQYQLQAGAGGGRAFSPLPPPATGVCDGTGLATGSTGKGVAHENRPPYYALTYIMKT